MNNNQSSVDVVTLTSPVPGQVPEPHTAKALLREKKKITHQQAIFGFSDSKTQQYLAMEGLKI